MWWTLYTLPDFGSGDHESFSGSRLDRGNKHLVTVLREILPSRLLPSQGEPSKDCRHMIHNALKLPFKNLS